MKVLVVCTANRCRSPMAAALLRRRLPQVEVASAGSLEPGHPASGGSVRAMASRGIDLGDHVSRKLEPGDAVDADLIVCLARQHLREVVVMAPAAFPKTFTLRELVRRGEAVGPVTTSFADWLALVGAGRKTSDLLGDEAADDIADPIGGPDEGYEATAVEIADLVDRLGTLLERS